MSHTSNSPPPSWVEDALELAAAEGLLREGDPQSVPEWFLGLGGDDVEAFEKKYSTRLPATVRQYFQTPELACALGRTPVGRDLDFFNPYGVFEGEPAVEMWDGKPCLVLAFHCHSGQVVAVRLDDDPVVQWGFDDDERSDKQFPFPRWIPTVSTRAAADRSRTAPAALPTNPMTMPTATRHLRCAAGRV